MRNVCAQSYSMEDKMKSAFTLFFLLTVLALSAAASPIFSNGYDFIPISNDSTANSLCNPNGASTQCVGWGTNSGRYLEMWINTISDPDIGWVSANSTTDDTTYIGWWNDTSLYNEYGGSSQYNSLYFYDTTGQSVGIWSSPDGHGQWTDEHERLRWQVNSSINKWSCPGGAGTPCASAGSWTNTDWGFVSGVNTWRNFSNGMLFEGSNPYAFNWGPNTNSGSYGDSAAPEPGTLWSMIAGLGLILGSAGYRKLSLARSRS